MKTYKYIKAHEIEEYDGWDIEAVFNAPTGECCHKIIISKSKEDPDLFEMIDKLKEDELKRRKNKIEPNKIEKVKWYCCEENFKDSVEFLDFNAENFCNKLNEIIDYINGDDK